ncbi:hypothetical protein GPJ56_000174 [Histomonas meleagridis]|uniref:uncharacterized protein n=1 Tax=Histomonas meleagridis TaxID=135588 RepID=UPI00355AC409|nr:hypothetical protein GPJ56_000174 [Histomonas meleagridis]KAH0806588.1 hypothetical protein GO595_000750 [Histomonas meleagridis]
MDEGELTEVTTMRKWEQTGTPWDGFKINENGQLVSETGTREFNSETAKKKHDLLGKRRGLIRALVVVIDITETALAPRQFGQSRISIIVKSLTNFITSFFDENPLSMLSIVSTYNYRATILTPLSRDIKQHIHALDTLSDINASGEPSIYNSIVVATSLLRATVKCSTKEILFFYGSMRTCDPKPLQESIDLLCQSPPCVASCIGFNAELDFLKRIAASNNGLYLIPTSTEHLDDILLSFVQPPGWVDKTQKMQFLPFGFPKTTYDLPAFQLDKVFHDRNNPPLPKVTNIQCPQCGTRVFDLPTFCPCCGHLLFSAGHLIRAQHHLRPILPYEKRSPKSEFACFGCNERFGSEEVYICQDCGNVFCADCDNFIHNTLQNCPGCLANNLNKK